MELMRECHESKYWFDLSYELEFLDYVSGLEDRAVEFFEHRGCDLDLENRQIVLSSYCCRPNEVLRYGQAEIIVSKHIKEFMELVV